MMSAVWEGLCNYIFCAVTRNMKLQAWKNMRDQEQTLQADPSLGSSGIRCGAAGLNTSLALCLHTPLPLALPLDLAMLLLTEQMASL